ncbi:MAG: amidohydrolase family protein [Methylobacteriaceae bacterium]|nr:amidohydrolase family protein [Methylobacteriaceae bacterium]
MEAPVVSPLAPVVRPTWLAAHREDILEPDLPIIDPHHHLLDRAEHGTYLLPDLLADLASGHNVLATVYLEWLSMYRADGPVEMRPVGEVEFANGVAAMSASGAYGETKVCAAIVGHAELPLGAALGPVLDAMIAAGGGRFRGVRFIACADPDQDQWGAKIRRPPGVLRDAKAREGFREVARRGLSFDTWLYHPQLGDVVDLARAFPDTPICVDHIGGPIGIARFQGKRAEVFADWSRSIRDLAACPNVHVKLGGMGMKIFGFGFHDAERAPGSEELAAAWRPYVETCIEAFGVKRAMFESNFPVDKVSYGYGVYWNTCKRLAKGLSEAEKADLFHATAKRFYKL